MAGKKHLVLVFLLGGWLLFLQGTVTYAQNGTLRTSDDSVISYTTYGSGVPLLIINGGPGMSSEGFVPLARKLAENNRSILYDQRGTGASRLNVVNASTITLDLMVRDIESLREHLGIENWIVMGHSFGGMLAYYYASKHPGRVLGMIQSSSGGMDLSLLRTLNVTNGLTQTERDSLAYYTARLRNGDQSYKTRLKRGLFLAPAYVYNRKHIPAIAERLTQGNSEINRLVWSDMQRSGFDTKESLKHFGKPVLIIHGRQDIVGTDLAETAHSILPSSRLVLLDRCRHYGWLDRPVAYFREVNDFLRQFQVDAGMD